MTAKPDYPNIFSRLPEVMGLQLIRKGRSWMGAYYLDGHASNRPDKITCKLMPDGGQIGILEQGGENMSLWDWLLRYGGCADNGEVVKRMGAGKPITRIETKREPWKEEKFKYCPTWEVKRSMSNGYNDNLFSYLAGKFGAKRVFDAFKRYRVGNYEIGGDLATVFWAIDREGRVCKDSWIKYGKDGHRIKEPGSIGSKYKVGDGYGNKAFFGEHLLPERGERGVMVVEAPKTALIMSCADTRHLYLATFGSSVSGKLSIGEDWRFIPDNDEAGRMWEKKYGEKCVAWADFYRGKGVEVNEGDDIGDAILKLNTNLKR